MVASSVTMEDRFVGCLLAGACGDALGEAVEFVDSHDIFRDYGPLGIREFNKRQDNRKAIFTDDTQMTLFTAEGLLSSFLPLLSSKDKIKTFQAVDAIPGLHQSYIRWLVTQKEVSESPLFKDVKDQGMLIKQEELYRRRSPGMTCTMSIRSGAVGSEDNRINDSKGCGGIMRVAPCALIVQSAFPDFSTDERAELAFRLGCVSAAITHTHPTGWLSSGGQAAIISRILSGDSLEDAIGGAISLLEKEPFHEETVMKMNQAKNLASEFVKEYDEAEPGDCLEIAKQGTALRHITALGAGFIGEEALAISLYCALITEAERDVERALCYSVNHGGDSDSTGAITGNLVGALYGEAAIPSKWKDNVEMSDLVREVSLDILHVADSSHQLELLVKHPQVITLQEGQPYYSKKENLVVCPFKMPAGAVFFEWANEGKKLTPW